MTLPTLRFLTCGSVDDGKSTLIGRLLLDQDSVSQDELAALARDSKKHGTVGDDLDAALLMDGLEAERQQGITIDVAYRYFATTKRAFIVADCPGHEQYTRNMATGASHADVAIILVDARKGLLAQTRRHAAIVSLLGLGHVVVAVNKIDLVGYDRAAFEAITGAFDAIAGSLGFASVTSIPVSARFGDNVSTISDRMPWYRGPSLLAFLESVDVDLDEAKRPFRFPVQWINRPHLDFRGYAGTVAGGAVRPGDQIVLATTGQVSTVTRIVTADGDQAVAQAGEAVTLTLADEFDIARGDVICGMSDRPEVAEQIAARLIWMSDAPAAAGTSYLMKAGCREVPVVLSRIISRLDITSFEDHPASGLGVNEVGACEITSIRPVVFDPYDENRTMGAFILIDRLSHATVAAGMIKGALRRATNIHPQGTNITPLERAALKRHRPAVLWFTGLSGAGKSTIANLVEVQLHQMGCHTMLLDGDNLRHGLSKDLGFSEADRGENIRRVGEVAKLMTEAGLIVLCSFISPFAVERGGVRALMQDGEFLEIFVDTPLDQCVARDPKGLYRKAMAGEIASFTGIDQPYEVPAAPDITVAGHGGTAAAAAARVVDLLVARGFVFPTSG